MEFERKEWKGQRHERGTRRKKDKGWIYDKNDFPWQTKPIQGLKCHNLMIEYSLYKNGDLSLNFSIGIILVNWNTFIQPALKE